MVERLETLHEEAVGLREARITLLQEKLDHLDDCIQESGKRAGIKSPIKINPIALVHEMESKLKHANDQFERALRVRAETRLAREVEAVRRRGRDDEEDVERPRGRSRGESKGGPVNTQQLAESFVRDHDCGGWDCTDPHRLCRKCKKTARDLRALLDRVVKDATSAAVEGLVEVQVTALRRQGWEVVEREHPSPDPPLPPVSPSADDRNAPHTRCSFCRKSITWVETWQNKHGAYLCFECFDNLGC
jgi:hypothetical protein